MHLALYALSARSEPELLTAVLRIVPASILGASLILAAGFVHGDGKPVIWVAALVIGFLGPFFADVRGWRLAPAHFVERHGRMRNEMQASKQAALFADESDEDDRAILRAAP